MTAAEPARCAACRRPLTDPASLAVGLGPVCRKRLDEASGSVAGRVPVRTPGAADVRPRAGPGQLELVPLQRRPRKRRTVTVRLAGGLL